MTIITETVGGFVNLVVTGAMTIAGAVGVRRVLGRSGDGGTWAPRLLVGFGVALIAAGIFRADSANGFPPGAPSGTSNHLTWPATLHVVSGSIGFGCLIALCFVFARLADRRGGRPLPGDQARGVGTLPDVWVSADCSHIR